MKESEPATPTASNTGPQDYKALIDTTVSALFQVEGGADALSALWDLMDRTYDLPEGDAADDMKDLIRLCIEGHGVGVCNAIAEHLGG